MGAAKAAALGLFAALALPACGIFATQSDHEAFVASVKHRGLRQVILAHLSENCNTPALALAAVRPCCSAPVIAAAQGTVTDPRPVQLELL